MFPTRRPSQPSVADEAVQAAGYFGPARVVFALLDGSDDGEIALDELGTPEMAGDGTTEWKYN